MRFNAELISTEEGRVQLAREIAAALNADSTNPIPGRDDWEGEKALRDLESDVVQTRGLYDEFVDICMSAFHLRSDSNPSVRALLLLGAISGGCHLPDGERPDDQLARLFRDARAHIDALNDSPRKIRLLSLWSYHSGIYARVNGDYKSAVVYQDRSADIVETAESREAVTISRFSAAVNRVNVALVDELPDIKVLLAKMREDGDVLKIALGGKTESKEAVRWLYFDLPIHLLFAHFWAGEQYDGSNEIARLRTLRSFNPAIIESHAATIAVAFAIHSCNKKNYLDACMVAASVILCHVGLPPAPEYLATAHLILARVAAKLHRRMMRDGRVPDTLRCSLYGDASAAHFRDVEAVAGKSLSARQVLAIARRALYRTPD